MKTGGNYAAAMGPTLAAKEKYKIDQVLFCPEGSVQETGAANFMLIDAERVITPALTTSFLHGVTRDSLLTIALLMNVSVRRNATGTASSLNARMRPPETPGLLMNMTASGFASRSFWTYGATFSARR